MSAPLPLGLLSTAKINDVLLAGAPDDVEIVAVASRDDARARAYADERGIERAHGSYEALLADPGVDAVYISLPNSLHHEWTLKALLAGSTSCARSPGLRRKPAASSSPRRACIATILIARAQELVASGAVGAPRIMRGNHSFHMVDPARRTSPRRCAGSASRCSGATTPSARRARSRRWGHLARANPQSQAVLDGLEVLAVFRGPDAYVSPSWYADAPNVPTWNFVVVRARGVPRPATLPDSRVRWILERTVEKYESRLEQPWRLEKAGDAYVEELLPHVVAFELEVTSLCGQFKLSPDPPRSVNAPPAQIGGSRLSQNQPLESRRSVVAGLSLRPDEASREVARLMAEADPRTRP